MAMMREITTVGKVIGGSECEIGIGLIDRAGGLDCSRHTKHKQYR